MDTKENLTLNKQRLLSLDAFRGFAMMMMLTEISHLNYVLIGIFSGKPVVGALVTQLQHHEWNGLYFWDLGQPYFTFVLGIAMALSLSKRLAQGADWSQTFRHILYRCSILFLLGLILAIEHNNQLTFELWNILVVLSFNILITFLIFKFRNSTQLIISFGLLIIYDMLYRLVSIDGFAQPYIKHHNLGTFMDLVLMGKTNHDGWVAINAIPTTVHAIWGVLTGKILLSSLSQNRKLSIITSLGLIGVVMGYGIDWTGIVPINKHISTSSFMIVSGGFCFLTYAVLYWMIDIMNYKKWTILFTVVGMNPMFIYLFSATIGRKWLNGFTAIFSEGILGRFFQSTGIIDGVSSILAIGFEWYLCYWLFKRKILIKL
ncbi:MAG: DUF5009 domain-containing protein [Nitrospirae bacterium]|nr:DUF5009 domain-containing protein [Nitrospirota bacterium]